MSDEQVEHPSALPDPASRAPITRPAAARWKRWLRWALPFLVSALLLAWVFSGIDVATVVARVTPRVALYFVPVLLVFLLLSLVIEARCLVLVVSHGWPFHDHLVAARIKAASYLLGILNYALGVGAVAVLLRRRAAMSLSDAAGSVFVIGLFDLGSLVGFVLFGLLLKGSDTAGVRAGVVVLAAGAILAGFVVLRAKVRLGPLDRIRDLQVLHAARTLPIPLLAQLGLLRVAFLCSFFLLAWSIMAGFAVEVPILDLVVGTSILLLIAALPIAAAGLGTGQVMFVALFERFATAETLLAASLTMSAGLLATRAAMGLVFAREFATEAFAARAEMESAAEDRGEETPR